MDESRINQINNNNNNNHNNTNNVNNINNAAANRNIESDPVKIQPVAKTPTAHEPPPMLSDQNSAESSGRQNKVTSTVSQAIETLPVIIHLRIKRPQIVCPTVRSKFTNTLPHIRYNPLIISLFITVDP
jgi:hypothetical protein